MRPSLTLCFSVLFLAFIGHSIWSLIAMFRAPVCNKNEICYHSYLNKKPNLQLLVYIADSSRSGNVQQLIYNERNFDWTKPIEKELVIELTRTVRKNGTLTVHSVITPKLKASEDLSFREAIRDPVASVVKGYLTQYAVPKSYAFNLLKEQGKEQSIKPVTHIKSRYGVLMCTDELHIPHTGIPVEVVRHLRVNNNHEFLPIVLEDLMQTKLKDLIEVTGDLKSVSFTYVYSPTTFGKLRFLLQIEATLKQFLTLGFTEKDVDEIRGVFADTNLYLLCATMTIGSIHLLLDFLSFKNDISFWKSHRSMAGLSKRTVLWRAFSQTIVFLYLLDEGTSLLVLIPAGVGTLIEFWKVKKVLKASITWEGGLKIRTDTTESKEEAQTRQYDDECMRYLSYILYPLCVAAAFYSLLYQPHKSWYSWTINSLVNGVYAFGFLFMLPQLFVNYRLKSVAALPWRAFTYRAFNTFIDDIFAFIITMPTAHRVACFRDDVVFLVYLYQRWLYPVDQNRRADIGDETADALIEDKKTK